MILPVNTFPGRILQHNGKTYTYFGGTAYLGLQTDTTFRKIFVKNVEKYGVSYTASRKSNIRFTIYEEAEALLARLTGSPASITLSSGYMAGQLVSAYFSQPGYKTFYAPSAHPALRQPHAQNYRTVQEFRAGLSKYINSTSPEIPVVYLDTIDFKEDTYPNINLLNNIPLDKIILVADDSHGLGVLGTRGGGAYHALQKLPLKDLIICGSLGKGFGVQAGVVLGSVSHIEKLMETNGFVAASPAPPHVVATLLAAQGIYEDKRRILASVLETFKKNVHNLDRFRQVNNHPAFSYSDESLTKHLAKNCLIVTNFKYPNGEMSALNRIVLSAHHTKEDIVQLATAINQYPTKPLR